MKLLSLPELNVLVLWTRIEHLSEELACLLLRSNIEHLERDSSCVIARVTCCCNSVLPRHCSLKTENLRGGICEVCHWNAAGSHDMTYMKSRGSSSDIQHVQNYRVFGHCSSSGILNTRKCNASRIGSVFALWWWEEGIYSVASLRKKRTSIIGPL